MPEESGSGGARNGQSSSGSASRFLADFRRKTDEYLTYGTPADNVLGEIGSFAELAATPAPDLQWVASNLIPSRTVTLLTGDGGAGKSLLAMQLMLSVASGTLWLGTQCMMGRAFGLFCEDDQDTLHRRIRALVKRLGLDADRCRNASYVSRAGDDAVLYGPSIEDPRTNEFTRLYYALAQMLRALRPDVAILDTAADVYSANENIRSQVREFIRALRDLAMDLKCAIVLCAHPSVGGLSSGRGFSGSTAWHNSVRSRLYLTPSEDDPDVRILQTMKANYGPKIDDIRLRYDDGAFVPEQDSNGFVAKLDKQQRGRAIIALVSEAAGAGRHLSEFRQSSPSRYLPQVAARKISGMTVTRAAKIMLDLLQDGIIETVIVDQKSKARGLVVREQPGAFKLAAE